MIYPLLASVSLNEPVVTRVVGLIRRRSPHLWPAAQQIYDFFEEIAPATRAVPPTRKVRVGK